MVDLLNAVVIFEKRKGIRLRFVHVPHKKSLLDVLGGGSAVNVKYQKLKHDVLVEVMFCS